MTEPSRDSWAAGDAYEAYMGRWSRVLARVFLEWLRPMPSAHWLEVGCGTGALTSVILEACQPASVVVVILRSRSSSTLGEISGPVQFRGHCFG